MFFLLFLAAKLSTTQVEKLHFPLSTLVTLSNIQEHFYCPSPFTHGNKPLYNKLHKSC